MDRRLFLGAGAALGLLARTQALAAGRCVSVAYGGMCTSQLAFDRVTREFDYQQQDRWCWAAAISMIFAFYGYRVSQDTIIERAYDGHFGLTGDFVENARQLNRPWSDERGKVFDCQIKPLFAVTPYAQNAASAEMIAALDRGHPVLLCDERHAMVLTSLTYANAPAMPQVTRAVVVDPWPDRDPHVHALDPDDLTAPPSGRLHLAAVVEVYATGSGDKKG
jgi:hypothetical protein